MTANFPNLDEVFCDRYRILRVLAEGGFGRVYLANQFDLDRRVAIKILRPEPKDAHGNVKTGAGLEAIIKRFEREARLVSKLRDVHTVTVHDFGSTPEGLLYMVMEYVDGRTISELIGADGVIAPERAVAIITQVLSSLQEAHQLGVLHRDIKPANIMLFDHLGRRDQVKVLDFGLVKNMGNAGSGNSSQMDLTSEGSLLGTPRYMSPEQIRGEDMGPPSDIYSLGLVFYEMLTGTRAVDADSTMNIIARHLDPRPFKFPAGSPIPPRLGRILLTMLAKEPDERYPTVDDVISALDTWELGDQTVPMAAASGEYPAVAQSAEIPVPPIVEASEGPADNSKLVAFGVIAGCVVAALFAGVVLLALRKPAEESSVQVEEPPPAATVAVGSEVAEPVEVPAANARDSGADASARVDVGMVFGEADAGTPVAAVEAKPDVGPAAKPAVEAPEETEEQKPKKKRRRYQILE